jgi:glycosyltransferase involved in cell wall biosynthesis
MGKSVVIVSNDREIDRRIVLMADTVEAAGWQVTIVAMPTGDESQRDDRRVVRLNLQRSNTVRARSATLYRGLRRVVPASAANLMRYLALRFVADPERYFFNLYSGVLSTMKPDVFVAVDLPVLGVTRWAAENAGALLVYDSHELFAEQDQSAWENARWRQIEEKHIRSCDAVITVNQSIARELERRYSLPAVNVVYNAVRLPQVLVQSKIFHRLYDLSPGDKIVLLQGGLSPGRNLEALVEAMRFVSGSIVHLVILGNGEMLERLKAITNRFDLLKRVHFHPAVPQDMLLSFTAAADIGVIPYQATCMNNLFCTPNKLFEYITAGVPILANDLPEIRRIVAGHDIGQVADLGGAKKIAALIDDCFKCESRLAHWRSNLQSVREILSWQQEEKTVLKIFDALQNEKASG